MESRKDKSGEKESPLPRLSQERKTKAIDPQGKLCIVNKGQMSGESLAQGLPGKVRYRFI